MEVMPSIELQKRHMKFLVDFTNQMVNFFEKMKIFYQKEQIKKKQVFKTYKHQIESIIHDLKIYTRKENHQKNKQQQQKKLKKNKKQLKQQTKLKKPKTPNSSYFMFFLDWKQQIKQDFPGQSIIEQAKMAGKLWKSLEQTERKVYEQRYQQQKIIYDKELQKYKQQKHKLQQQKQEQEENHFNAKQRQQSKEKICDIKMPDLFSKILEQANSPIKKITEIQLSISSSIDDEHNSQELNTKPEQLLQRLKKQSQMFEQPKTIKPIYTTIENKLSYKDVVNDPSLDSLGEDSI